MSRWTRSVRRSQRRAFPKWSKSAHRKLMRKMRKKW